MLSFKKTLKQREASKIIKSDARNVMLFGGSRSGKTFMLVYAMIVRAMKCKSRHIILRQNFNHIKTSIWADTLPKVMSTCFPEYKYTPNKTDYFIPFHNGSELWVAGLDDEKRVEKILGKEFSTIYFNECSQIPYKSIGIATTRLAEKNALKKKIFYDENPPSKKHWSYWLFVKRVDPVSSEPLDPNKYAALLMNPRDNLANIDEEYIGEVLSQMPENMRKRFELGEFVDDHDGLVYYSFDRDKNVKEFGSFPGSTLIGMDFNVNPMTAVCAKMSNNILHIFDEAFLENSDTFKMAHELSKRGHSGAMIYPDSTGANRKTSGRSDHQILKDSGFRIEATRNPLVFDRVNNVNYLLKNEKIIIHPRCKKLINDLEKVSWRGQDLDQKSDQSLTHISDALGYLSWHVLNSFINKPGAISIS
jgi:PBSX family phage terminase large subunit